MTLKFCFIAAILTCGFIQPTVSQGGYKITVANPLPQPRSEIVEVEGADLPSSTCILRDSNGFEIPWQKTYDGKLIFPVNVAPSSVSEYFFSEGIPASVDTIACASFHPERVDDIAWENDYAAYRAYGPAFGATGGKAFGYDVWTKSNTRPVVVERYLNELVRGKSYHKDFGDGMDVYDVGPSLGGGATAPIAMDGSFIYPGCFSEWEILDNGPLRTTLKLKFEYGGGVDERLITLDAGNPLNKTKVTLTGFNVDSIAAGIVVHTPMENGYILADEYVAVADPTQKPSVGNGLIFLGIVNTAPNANTGFRSLPQKSGSIAGHVISTMPVEQKQPVEYYWGTCWSKGMVRTFDQWNGILKDAALRLANPLTVTVSSDVASDAVNGKKN